MPYGCGEQNMLNFAPDVYILQYLQAIGKSEGSARSTALQYINYGWPLNVHVLRDVDTCIGAEALRSIMLNSQFGFIEEQKPVRHQSQNSSFYFVGEIIKNATFNENQ
jgi:hypothetical protein